MSVWPHSEGRCQPSESRNSDGGGGLKGAGGCGASGCCSVRAPLVETAFQMPDAEARAVGAEHAPRAAPVVMLTLRRGREDKNF